MVPNAMPQTNEITAITRCTVKNAVMPPVGPHDLGSCEMLTMNVGQMTSDQIPNTTMNQATGRETRIPPGDLVSSSDITGCVTRSVSVLAGVSTQSGLN